MRCGNSNQSSEVESSKSPKTGCRGIKITKAINIEVFTAILVSQISVNEEFEAQCSSCDVELTSNRDLFHADSSLMKCLLSLFWNFLFIFIDSASVF